MYAPNYDSQGGGPYDDANVTDDLKLYHFFERIAPTDKGRFETEAAIQVGLDVLAELHSNP